MLRRSRRLLSPAAVPLSEASNPPLFSPSTLSPPRGARPPKKRVGRGPGSGTGKNAARGMGGKRSRAGLQGRVWFEGGQSPLIKRIPKHGFSRAALKKPLQELDLSALARFVRAGRVDASQPVTLRALHESGVVGRFRHGVKLLGADALEGLPPLRLEVSGASRAAREAVERAGGEVRLVYFNRLGLRAHTKPHKFDMMPKRARVPPRLRDRGLAVPTIEEQIEEAARLGKVLNPPYNYREAPAARK